MVAYKSLGYEIARVHKALRAKFQKVLKPRGITVQQFEVMRALRADSGITAAQLVERIISDSSTMMVILNSLESKKLITRKSDGKDRRTKQIYLTKEGHRLVEDLMSYADKFNKRVQNCCSAEELQVVKQVLSKLYAFSRIDEDLQTKKGKLPQKFKK